MITEEFIKSLSTPLAEALVQFGYWMTEERDTETQKIFEFTSQDAPRMEVRLDK